MCVCICIRACVCIHICMHRYIYINISLHIYVVCVFQCHPLYSSIRVCIYIYMHVCMYIYTCTYTYIYTYTYIFRMPLLCLICTNKKIRFYLFLWKHISRCFFLSVICLYVCVCVYLFHLCEDCDIPLCAYVYKYVYEDCDVLSVKNMHPPEKLLGGGLSTPVLPVCLFCTIISNKTCILD